MDKVTIDTNVILRYIEKVNPLFKKLTQTNNVFITNQIIVETMYVLEKVHEKARVEVLEIISIISNTENVTIEDKEVISNMLKVYMFNKKLSVIDCYLIAFAQKNKLKIETLDKEILKYLNQTHNA